jgi:predicted metal-dependent peptidase
MNAQQKILKAKVGLVLEQPFFATLLLRTPVVEDTTVETACTNGKRISYNPTFIDGLTLDQCKGCLAHEVLHGALLHHTRRNNRDLKKWNVACDYAINPMVLDASMQLPEGSLVDDSFKDMSVEKIFSMLPPDPPPENGNDKPDPGNCGAVEDAPANSQSEITEQEAEMKQALAQAVAVAKRAGKLPAGMERLIQEVLEPKIHWQEVLARFITEIVRNDYSFKKPNARFLHTGFYLPTLENEEVGRVVLIVDTSGSITAEQINEFGAEMQDICNTFGIGFTVIFVDYKVANVQEFEKDEPLNLKPKGGGGTDFIPGFDYIEENDLQPKAVVYFTDGQCSSFPEAPDYPVLWAQNSGVKFNPPFGEVIKL